MPEEVRLEMGNRRFVGMSRPSHRTLLVLATLATFAVWELSRHLLLMQLSMASQHLVSAVVEIGLALVVAAIAVHAIHDLAAIQERASHLATVIAHAVAIQDRIGDPKTGLLAQATWLLERLRSTADNETKEALVELVDAAEQAHRVMVGLRWLAEPAYLAGEQV